ncbi:hypothetical protein K8R42_01665 [bacterium]|nr:hypothetical protein [bacterium]
MSQELPEQSNESGQDKISDLQFELAQKVAELVGAVPDDHKKGILRKWGELEELIRAAKSE